MTTTSKSSPRPAVAGRTAHEQNDPGEMRSRFTSNATAVHWSSGVIESRDPNAGEGGRGFLPGSAFAPEPRVQARLVRVVVAKRRADDDRASRRVFQDATRVRRSRDDRAAADGRLRARERRRVNARARHREGHRGDRQDLCVGRRGSRRRRVCPVQTEVRDVGLTKISPGPRKSVEKGIRMRKGLASFENVRSTSNAGRSTSTGAQRRSCCRGKLSAVVESSRRACVDTLSARATAGTPRSIRRPTLPQCSRIEHIARASRTSPRDALAKPPSPPRSP